MEKVDFLTKKIECTTSIPLERAWSREFKNVLLFVSIAPYAEISESEGAKKGPFCMGILATLGLSTEFEPRAEKKILLIRWS